MNAHQKSVGVFFLLLIARCVFCLYALAALAMARVAILDGHAYAEAYGAALVGGFCFHCWQFVRYRRVGSDET